MYLVGLIFCCVLATPVWGSEDNIRTIWCTDPSIRSQKNLIEGLKREDMICEAEKIGFYDFKWTIDPELTPPRPENISIEVKSYETPESNNSRQIAVFVTWTYKVQYLDLVEHYHIEQNDFFGKDRQYLMKFDDTLPSVLKSSSAPLVKFGFIFSGKPGNYHIRPCDDYRFRIQSYPIYQENDDPQDIEDYVTIPGCENPMIAKTRHCKRRYAKKKCQTDFPPDFWDAGADINADFFEVETASPPRSVIPYSPTEIPVTQAVESEREDEFEPTYMALIMLGGILIIGFMVLAAWAHNRRKFSCFWTRAKSSAILKVPGKRRVLFVCTSDIVFERSLNHLVDMFAKLPDIDVTSNLWQRNEIGEQGITEWTKKNVNDSDVIVLLVGNSYEVNAVNHGHKSNSQIENFYHNEVGVILKAAEKMTLKDSVDVGDVGDVENGIKSEYTDKKFVLIDLKSCLKRRDLPYFKWFRFPADFCKFEKLVSGGTKTKVDSKEKEIFSHLLEIAKLSQEQSKLDQPDMLTHTREDSEIEVNISGDSPAQVLRNQSLGYPTRDDNYDSSIGNHNNLDNPNSVLRNQDSTLFQQNVVSIQQPNPIGTQSYVTTDFNNIPTTKKQNNLANPPSLLHDTNGVSLYPQNIVQPNSIGMQSCITRDFNEIPARKKPNNLENTPPSLPNGQAGNLQSQNIMFDSQPSSIESNSGVLYVTIDYNTDQGERYRQAGARPKTRC